MEQHPSVQGVLRWLQNPDHLPAGKPKTVFIQCGELADYMANVLPSSAELTAGLRKLLEAKDCFVRCAVAEEKKEA